MSTKTKLQAGETIDNRYQVERLLGVGGMSAVYLVLDTVLQCRRALKLLDMDLFAKDPAAKESFLREARIAAKLHHKNIVNVMEVHLDSTSDLQYIVMEYVDGKSVKEVLKDQGRYEVPRALEIIELVAEVLQCAQSLNIVHRDIKPDNIMLTKAGDVKLADVGIAKIDPRLIGMDESQQDENEDTVLGTPSYASPEQFADPDNVDVRSDIYSLGATLYHMVTGSVPFYDDDPYKIIQMVWNAPVPNPQDVIPEIPDAVAALIMRMMAKNSADRPQNPGELLNEIKDIRLLQKLEAPEQQKIVEEQVEAQSNAAKVDSLGKFVQSQKKIKRFYISVYLVVLVVVSLSVFYWSYTRLYLGHEAFELERNRKNAAVVTVELSKKLTELQKKEAELNQEIEELQQQKRDLENKAKHPWMRRF